MSWNNGKWYIEEYEKLWQLPATSDQRLKFTRIGYVGERRMNENENKETWKRWVEWKCKLQGIPMDYERYDFFSKFFSLDQRYRTYDSDAIVSYNEIHRANKASLLINILHLHKSTQTHQRKQPTKIRRMQWKNKTKPS